VKTRPKFIIMGHHYTPYSYQQYKFLLSTTFG
jgi:hypothetical protein